MPQVLGGAFVAVVMTYAFQGLIPVFNNDDVRQVQPPETMAMITQGRWLYYVVFNKLLDQNPLPGLSTFVGSACLVGAAWMHAKLIGLKHPSAVLVLTVVSSVSLYYGYMFDFDSTRIAYPLGNLVSAAGLLVINRSDTTRSHLAGVILLSLGPAFYPATLMYQVTLLIAAAIYWCLCSGTSPALRGLVRGFLAIVAGVVVYRVLTILIYAVVGFELDDRGSLNPLGLVDNWAALQDLFSANAMPFIAPTSTAPYFSTTLSYLVLLIFMVFFVSLFTGQYSALNATQLAGVIAGFAALLVSPFFMIAFTETDYYPIRSLYSFAAVYGALLAIAFERSAVGAPAASGGAARTMTMVGRPPWMPAVVLVVAASFAFVNASLVGQKSYDQSLAWQSDVAQINRIIYRIDDVIGGEPSDSAMKAPLAQIPIVVVGDVHWRSGPRGEAVSAWLHPWSKENIFSLLDNRFIQGSAQQRERAIQAASDREPWPSEGSVFIDGDLVVVVR